MYLGLLQADMKYTAGRSMLEPKAATPPASKEENSSPAAPSDAPLPLAVGSVVRICGLKSAPQLNGTLAEDKTISASFTWH
ncbi:hypothetical protein AK812_SmicGene15254 [Symbiodinium microadriaticum]|uniref:Uncharacterized protein n=1 Tax=Symbiodinium microadriaticum TaxID=2951 RepID=A0A1Q9E3I0_SYMMI|nr:hypothetical protein AK812_SmicGene15254 [Symbiodinium microadriaticum]